MISAVNLSKRFGDVWALRDVNLDIEDGELFGLVGPNGAGKTTFVRILCGILEPTEGTIYIDDLDVRRYKLEIKRRIGYLQEEPSLYGRMRVIDFLSFYAEIYGLRGGEKIRRIRELLELLGIEDRAESKISSLSKGLRQRVALARALINDPDILVLDEPTMGLDPYSARLVRDYIRRLRREGRTIVMCTHYMPEAEELCDRIAFMSKGSIVMMGTPSELKRRLASSLNLLIEVSGEGDPRRALERVLGSGEIEELRRGLFLLRLDRGRDPSEILGNLSKLDGVRITSLRLEEGSLEEAFVRLVEGSR